MKLKNKKLLIFVLIPLVLFLIGFIGSIFLNSLSISTLIYPLNKNIFISSPKDYMVKGDKIVGEFTAKKNYLGILQIKFNKFRGINYHGNDRLNFVIKDKNTNWTYSGIYPISEFDKSFTLPFGFPIQEDSFGRTYHFEIVSEDGKKTNSIILSENEPVVSLVYKYPKKEILSSPIVFGKFFITKIYFLLINVDFLLSSIIFYVPLFFYSLIVLLKMKFSMGKQFLAYISIISILVDSIFFVEYNSGILFILLGFWVVCTVLYKFDYTVSILANVILSALALIIMFYSPLDPILDKLGIYIFFLFIISLIQMIFTLNSKEKDRLDYQDVLRGFLHAKIK